MKEYDYKILVDTNGCCSRAPLNYLFEWNNGTEETTIVVSLHAAMKLAETFKEFGYVEKRGESLNHMFGDVPKDLDKLTVIKEEKTK